MDVCAIEFPRIAGGKPFDTELPWFNELLADIHQPKGKTLSVDPHHGEEIPSIPPVAP